VPAMVPAETDVLQMHSTAYRNPAQLPDGAVLVAGSGSSGTQIAEELLEAVTDRLATWLAELNSKTSFSSTARAAPPKGRPSVLRGSLWWSVRNDCRAVDFDQPLGSGQRLDHEAR
jgi:cation diffusion facilitator CzcD-associated flavoprotein CzcO